MRSTGVDACKALGVRVSRADVLAQAKADTGKSDGRRITKLEKAKAAFELISEMD